MSKTDIKKYKEYCTGCGLCAAIKNVTFEKDEKGFLSPNLSEDDLEFCKRVCPCGGNAFNNYQKDSIWGETRKTIIAWSCDTSIRHQASSGGVITSICIYLLESKKVDGIIQIKADEKKPYSTSVVISRNREDVLNCMGSRYAASSPLLNINELLKQDGSYAFVGKPCDVSALRMMMIDNEEFQEKIKYLLSFFCAGIPSENANMELLYNLDCHNVEDCVSLSYRGNGWPGFATAKKMDGTENSISYDESWGKILGRDVRKICRYCIDGMGEMADISCGDAWYIGQDGKPNFSEADGRNIVFARTKKGETLLNKVISTGYIIDEEVDAFSDYLKTIQNYQFVRKATMKNMIDALKVSMKNAPNYSVKKLSSFSKCVSWKIRIKRFFGTIRRLLNSYKRL